MLKHLSVPVVLFAVGVAVLCAQDGDRGRTFSCESTSGQRQYCPSDVNNGVRMVRQLGDTTCVEGYNWGRDEHGVWVDRGCRAEFVPLEARRALPDITRIEQGTVVPVRTNQYISSARADGRIFTGSVSQDVMGTNGALAIPQGSDVELIVRNAADGELILDLESVMINGRRYAVAASANRIDADKKEGVGANERTGKFVGGGALLGGIIGAIAGGGKGAAIGAGVGAAAGAGDEMATRGKEVRVPAETLVSFQLSQPLVMGVADDGRTEGGEHFHGDRP